MNRRAILGSQKHEMLCSENDLGLAHVNTRDRDAVKC